MSWYDLIAYVICQYRLTSTSSTSSHAGFALLDSQFAKPSRYNGSTMTLVSGKGGREKLFTLPARLPSWQGGRGGDSGREGKGIGFGVLAPRYRDQLKPFNYYTKQSTSNALNTTTTSTTCTQPAAAKHSTTLEIHHGDTPLQLRRSLPRCPSSPPLLTTSASLTMCLHHSLHPSRERHRSPLRRSIPSPK